MNIECNDKKVLVRVDFNVPLNEQFQITDNTRIRAAIPTLRALLDNGAALILMSHLGRPSKKLLPDGSIDVEKFTLRHLVSPLTDILGVQVNFAPDCGGPASKKMAAVLQSGEVLLLENTRFYEGETKGDPEFARALADLGDAYVNDAFGTAHRAHASTTTIAQFFDRDQKDFGLLMAAELENGKKLLEDPAHPFTAIIGGAKVSDKILLLEKLLELVDNILIGGGMAYTFLKAKGGKIGTSLCEDSHLELALEILKKGEEKGVRILLPEDSVVADQFSNEANTHICSSMEIPDQYMGLDIGPKAIFSFNSVISASETIMWNGPLGVFEMEKFAHGSFEIAKAIAKATSEGNAYSLIGGGDSVAAINKSGLSQQVSFISTGGGAMLELLEGKLLPGVQAILE